MRSLPTSVSPSSVFVAHFRPVVTSRKLSKTDSQELWNYIEIGTADCVAAFWSSPRGPHPLGLGDCPFSAGCWLIYSRDYVGTDRLTRTTAASSGADASWARAWLFQYPPRWTERDLNGANPPTREITLAGQLFIAAAIFLYFTYFKMCNLFSNKSPVLRRWKNFCVTSLCLKFLTHKSF